jgi:hypothetical protein
MSMAATTAKNLLIDPIPVTVRLDAELHRRLRESAHRYFRSVNAEINHRVRASFEQTADRGAKS